MASTIYQRLNRQGMATIFGKYSLITGGQTVCNHCLNLSTSSSLMIKWRYDQDIEPNPNRFGPLTDSPDYSFVDGRPVPISKSFQTKLNLQKSFCEKIVQLSNEMDFAVERHKQMNEESKEETRKFLESKLKEKGLALEHKKKQK